MAARNGNVDVVKLLIENGADVDAENYKRMRPINYAFNYGFKEVVQILIENNANTIDPKTGFLSCVNRCQFNQR